MRAKSLLTIVILTTAAPVLAATFSYGWEDGTGTILAMYPADSLFPYNVTAPDPVFAGDHSLKLVDNGATGITPQGYLAWVTGLTTGDIVTASFWRYDTTPGSGPSARIWAHWNDNPGDLMGFNGSASGNSDYGPGTGWDQTSYSWTVSSPHTGLVIEVRTYTDAGHTVWLDDLAVTIPDTASVVLMPEPTGLALLALGACGLIRRR